MVRVCVVGCLHGQLDQVYTDIETMDREAGEKTELVLCCGDFQAIRNPADLQSLSVPVKYYEMGDFYRYYSEEISAPILTIFVGGNHEASNYLQELPYGGWVAPNIWYMGYAGVVQFNGLRIGGLSGIYKLHDYSLGHYERPPYSEATKRSVYHIRNLEVFRLSQVTRRLDIMLSHDWPRGIYHYGDKEKLLHCKRHFRMEVNNNTLGSPPAEQLLCKLKPRYWFAAHMHVKFPAVVQHENSPDLQTKFLALDKCLHLRDYIQFLDIEPDPQPSTFNDEGQIVGGDGPNAPIIISNILSEESPSEDSMAKLFIDPEWSCILQCTNEFLSLTRIPAMLPGQTGSNVRSYVATPEALKSIHELFGGTFSLPHNFERTAPIYKPGDKVLKKQELAAQSQADARQQKQAFSSNPQTELLCAMLELTNPNAVLLGQASYNLSEMANMLVEQGELDEDDDIVDDDDNDGSGVEPSPAKLARVDSNPEEINLDDLGVDDEEENTNDGGVVEGYEPGVVAVNNAEYNPKYLTGCELSSASEYYPEGATVGGIGVEYSPNPIYTSEALLTEGNEYNPEPIVKNPEVIDIDNLTNDDDDDETSAGKEPQEEYEPGGVELDVTYNPQPFIEDEEKPTEQEDAGQDENLSD